MIVFRECEKAFESDLNATPDNKGLRAQRITLKLTIKLNSCVMQYMNY